MNRRQFLTVVPATAAVAVFPRIAHATDDEVTAPVEPCPCDCSTDGGVTWFPCDEVGNPIGDEPDQCADGVTDCPSIGTPPEWPPIVQFPNTGSGPVDVIEYRETVFGRQAV